MKSNLWFVTLREVVGVALQSLHMHVGQISQHLAWNCLTLQKLAGDETGLTTWILRQKNSEWCSAIKISLPNHRKPPQDFVCRKLMAHAGYFYAGISYLIRYMISGWMWIESRCWKIEQRSRFQMYITGLNSFYLVTLLFLLPAEGYFLNNPHIFLKRHGIVAYWVTCILLFVIHHHFIVLN